MPQSRNRPSASDWEPKFLESLRRFANVREACRVAGVSRSMVYARRGKAKKFREAWDDAIEEALDNIELAVVSASLKGDMATARWFLSRRRPQVYGDRVAMEHTGRDGDPLIPRVEVVWQTAESEKSDAP